MGKHKRKTAISCMCKVCGETVSKKTGLQCQGKCEEWYHFTCLDRSFEEMSETEETRECSCEECRRSSRPPPTGATPPPPCTHHTADRTTSHTTLPATCEQTNIKQIYHNESVYRDPRNQISFHTHPSPPETRVYYMKNVDRMSHDAVCCKLNPCPNSSASGGKTGTNKSATKMPMFDISHHDISGCSNHGSCKECSKTKESPEATSSARRHASLPQCKHCSKSSSYPAPASCKECCRLKESPNCQECCKVSTCPNRKSCSKCGNTQQMATRARRARLLKTQKYSQTMQIPSPGRYKNECCTIMCSNQTYACFNSPFTNAICPNPNCPNAD